MLVRRIACARLADGVGDPQLAVGVAVDHAVQVAGHGGGAGDVYHLGGVELAVVLANPLAHDLVAVTSGYRVVAGFLNALLVANALGAEDGVLHRQVARDRLFPGIVGAVNGAVLRAGLARARGIVVRVAEDEIVAGGALGVVEEGGRLVVLS